MMGGCFKNLMIKIREHEGAVHKSTGDRLGYLDDVTRKLDMESL
jgi:hypothetical protein